MKVVSTAIRRAIARVLPLLPPPRVIMDRAGGTPYLSRYYLFGGPRRAPGDDGTTTWSKLPVNLYLHHFHRGDDDDDLHNHPWTWSLAFVLTGGYREERRARKNGSPTDKVVVRVVPPLSFNFIRGDDFHRVDLLEDDAWTLFLAGPKAFGWGFWDRHTHAFLPWREFIARKRGIDVQHVPE